MKCAICKRKTNYNKSYGYSEFIVCPKCFNELHYKYNITDTMELIFILGDIAKKNNIINN